MGYSAEVVQRARARLAQAKEDRESENRQHLAQAYAKVPRIREIDMLLRRTMAQAAQAAFLQGSDGQALLEQARQENLGLQRERAALAAANFEEGFLDESPICDKCGGVMVEREGKYGKFLACLNYPRCKNTRNLDGTSERKQDNFDGVCPECGKPTRKMTSKTGKTFYGCTGYPDCKFMSWDKPTGKKCPVCGSYTVEVNGKERCSNRKCTEYEKAVKSERIGTGNRLFLLY